MLFRTLYRPKVGTKTYNLKENLDLQQKFAWSTYSANKPKLVL